MSDGAALAEIREMVTAIYWKIQMLSIAGGILFGAEIARIWAAHKRAETETRREE